MSQLTVVLPFFQIALQTGTLDLIHCFSYFYVVSNWTDFMFQRCISSFLIVFWRCWGHRKITTMYVLGLFWCSKTQQQICHKRVMAATNPSYHFVHIRLRPDHIWEWELDTIGLCSHGCRPRNLVTPEIDVVVRIKSFLTLANLLTARRTSYFKRLFHAVHHW